MRVKMSKPPQIAPTASAIGSCPTVIKIVGRPGTGSLPSTIAPPDHPPYNTGKSQKICLSSLIRKYVLERLSSDYLAICQCSGISAERPEKSNRLSQAYHKYQNQLIKLAFILHFIHTRVYAYTNQTLQTRRLSRVFLADRKVYFTPARFFSIFKFSPLIPFT